MAQSLPLLSVKMCFILFSSTIPSSLNFVQVMISYLKNSNQPHLNKFMQLLKLARGHKTERSNQEGYQQTHTHTHTRSGVMRGVARWRRRAGESSAAENLGRVEIRPSIQNSYQG